MLSTHSLFNGSFQQDCGGNLQILEGVDAKRETHTSTPTAGPALTQAPAPLAGPALVHLAAPLPSPHTVFSVFCSYLRKEGTRMFKVMFSVILFPRLKSTDGYQSIYFLL